jgi:hypothetical protein
VGQQVLERRLYLPELPPQTVQTLHPRLGRAPGQRIRVVPDVAEKAEPNCIRLKQESQHDSDVAIVRAEDLKWVAENWGEYTGADEFNLAVFNDTGILKRNKLEQMMDVLL